MIETPKVSDQSLIYMYGLSDFWSDIFGDTELAEAVLASSTITIAEVYSYFLQRAAGISLQDVGTKFNTRIELLILRKSHAIDDSFTSFKIDPDIISSSHISNRPILPTQVLVDNVHYEIIGDTITFQRPIGDMKFPERHLSDGDVAYALWMNDVDMNPHWLENSFGRLVGFTEDDAIFNYKSFLEGIYYLYTNGPNISFIERGINLAMGMPYARESEYVLSVQQDKVSGNWSVFTDTQEYVLPYGYRPDLSQGDYLQQNKVLVTWVTIKDHVKDGAWWYDVYLPRNVLGGVSTPYSVGKCSKGSTGDTMMENFLKHHMFEVLVTQPSGDERSFDTAMRLVMYSKPEYTFPIFVWKVPVSDEIIDLNDELSINVSLSLEDTCIYPPSIRFMDRGVDDDMFSRGKHWYNRVQGSVYAASMLGYGDWENNAGWIPEFESVDPRYMNYLEETMRTRGDTVSPINRGVITRGWRGHDCKYKGGLEPQGITWSVPGPKVVPPQMESEEINERNITPLYMMTTYELVSKVLPIYGRFVVQEDDYIFALKGLKLPDVYDTIMQRGEYSEFDELDSCFDFRFTKGGLDIELSDFANQAFVPSTDSLYTRAGNPITEDTILITRSYRDVWVVQWVHSDKSLVSTPTLFPVEDYDKLEGTEVYDQGTLGRKVQCRDRMVLEGQYSVPSPVLLGTEATVIITEGNMVVPPYDYTISDGSVAILRRPTAKQGFASFFPYGGSNKYLAANGSVYAVEGEYTRPEDLILVNTTGGGTADYTVLLDYTVSVEGGVTTVTLGSPITSGDLLVFPTDSENCPDSVLLQPSGLNYDVHSGYTIKIFTEGKLVQDTEYSVSSGNLSFYIEPSSEFTVRYYRNMDITVSSSFTRSSVARNRARCLIDRGRENGEYTNDGETVYMNRGGAAWKEVPALGEVPVYADDIKVSRRLI